MRNADSAAVWSADSAVVHLRMPRLSLLSCARTVARRVMSTDAGSMKSQRVRRSWAAWARAGSIAMAALAFVSLGVTVVTSQRALSDASDVVIRGEGDLLL